MKIGAFIIHLARATQRRPQVDALRQALSSLPVGIVDAVDGNALSKRETAGAFQPELLEPVYPFALRPGEIGCFLSHRAAWQAIVDQGLDAGLVLEDDVEIDAAVFSDALAMALREIGKAGAIQFQVRDIRQPGPVVASSGGCSVHLPVVTPLRGACTLYSAAAARRLVDTSLPFDRPVDTFIQMHWITGVKPAIVVPSGVREVSAAIGGTTIQSTSAEKKRGLAATLKREVRRFLYRRRVAALSARA